MVEELSRDFHLLRTTLFIYTGALERYMSLVTGIDHVGRLFGNSGHVGKHMTGICRECDTSIVNCYISSIAKNTDCVVSTSKWASSSFSR